MGAVVAGGQLFAGRAGSGAGLCRLSVRTVVDGETSLGYNLAREKRVCRADATVDNRDGQPRAVEARGLRQVGLDLRDGPAEARQDVARRRGSGNVV